MARRLGGSTLFLLLIAAWLVRYWPDRSLWYDETVNAHFAEQSTADIWEWCTEIDNQVPLHFLLLKWWGSTVGTSEFALRAFSVGCALLSAAGLIALGKRVGGRAVTGWLSVLVFALSQSFLYAAYEVCPYSLALALFVWSSVFLWELWERYAAGSRPLDRTYWLLLAAYLILALGVLYTHYTGFFALGAQGIYLGLRTLSQWSRRRVLILVQLGLGIMIGYVPWMLSLSGRDIRAGTAYEGHVLPATSLPTYIQFYAYGQQSSPAELTPWTLAQYWDEHLSGKPQTVLYGSPSYDIAAVTLVIAAPFLWLIFYRHERDHLKGFVFALISLLVPLAGLLVMVYSIQGKLSGRHGWPLWIGFSLLLGLGLGAVSRLRWLRWPLWAAALLLIWLPTTAELQPIYNSDLRGAFAYINKNAQPHDTLVLRDGTLFTAASYYNSRVPWIGLPPEKITDVHRFLTYQEAVDGINRLVEQEHAKRVWIVAWQGQVMDPEDLITGILEYVGDPQPIGRSFGDVFVSLYTLHDSPAALNQVVSSFGPLVQVPPSGPTFYGGYVLEQNPVPHGSIIHIHTWWQRGDLVMPDMRVSIRLYGPDGTFYSQLDQPPVGWSFGQENWEPRVPILSRFAVWVPYEIPAGTIDVKMLLYDMKGRFEPITVLVDRFEVED